MAVLIFLPVPLLVAIFILPGLVWLSLFGLAVPAVLVEGLGVRAASLAGLRSRGRTSSTSSAASRRSHSS